MSKLNGDRARFHKDRKRKLLHRQRIHAFIGRQRQQTGQDALSRTASVRMQDEGGPVRVGD